MVRKIKESSPKNTLQDDLDQRALDIAKILQIKSGEGAEFTSENINAWKTAFHKILKTEYPDRKFTFKSSGNKTFKVWRII